MKRLILWMVVVSSLFFGSSTPSLFQNSLLQRELAILDERGVTYRMLAANQLEVTDPESGQRWMFDVDRVLTPRKPAFDTIPTLNVDLRTIDTNLYNWRFHYWNSLPLTDGWGYPMEVWDFDLNGEPEAYGAQQTQSNITNRIYELDGDSMWVLRKIYSERLGVSNKSGDVDGNGLRELCWKYGDSIFVYEQPALDSLPTRSKFRHMQWYGNATGIPNQIDFMTGGQLPEIVYRGSEPVTSDEGTYVVRYDSSLNNFRRIWGAQLPPGCQASGCAGQLATGDFDGDNKNEFVTSNFAGNVYVIEHAAGDSFGVTWSTALSVAGRAAAGDVDGNGVPEFFIGGTQAEPDGYVHLRAYAFERTSDNTYQPIFAFNIFPAGIFFVDLYQTTDVDGDGVPELLLSFAGGIAMFKGDGKRNYQLFYYKPVSSLDGIAAWKINNNRAATLFVSRSIGSQPIISQTDVYRLDSTLITSADQEAVIPTAARLFHSYPNPFNPHTTITFELPQYGHVILEIFDLAGREVTMLVNEKRRPGTYSLRWTPPGNYLASGIYFVRLMFDGNSYVNKILFLK